MSKQRQFGRYTVIEELGKGGFATVYKAHDNVLERFVALKVLHRYWADDPDFVDRFKHEARTAAKLSHPNIITIFDTGQEAGHIYIAMTYIEGRTLDKVIAQESSLSIKQATRITEQIASALDYAHSQGVIHRDIKPSNIIIENNSWGEIAKLLDFGLVKAMEKSETLTTTGAILGTPAYMSPEQVHGEENLDERSDIYSLGIVLYEILTGKLPFEANTPTKQMMKHVLDPVPDILKTEPSLPPAIGKIIQKVLAKDPDDRYQSGAELVAALKAWDVPPAMIIPTVPETTIDDIDEKKQGMPIWVWMAGIAVLVLLLGIWAVASIIDNRGTEELSREPEIVETTKEKVPTLEIEPTITPPTLEPSRTTSSTDEISQLATAEPELTATTTTHTTEPLPTNTSIPTATPQPLPTPSRIIDNECFSANVWTPHPIDFLQMDNNNCWQLADWGLEAEDDGLSFLVSSPNQAEVKGLSSKINGDIIIEFDIKIDQLWTPSGDSLANVAIGILPSHLPENFGHLYYQKESPATGYPIYLKHTERGGFDAYMTWTGIDDYIQYDLGTVHHITMSLIDDELTIYLDETKIAGPMEITYQERFFWIGYRIPVGGQIDADISNLSIEFIN